MQINFRNNPKVKYIENSHVSDLLTNQENSTVTVFKKFYEGGNEIIRGFFVSSRKLKPNEEINSECESDIYYSTNKNNSYENNNFLQEKFIAEPFSQNLMKKFNENNIVKVEDSLDLEPSTQRNLSKPDTKNLVTNFFQFLIISFLILILIDICYYFIQLNEENSYEREMCLKEYQDHSCEKIRFEDGPILNEFCLEKKKCINFKYKRVSFHSLLSRFIKEVFFNFFASFTEMSYKTFLSTIVILISCCYIKKFI